MSTRAVAPSSAYALTPSSAAGDPPVIAMSASTRPSPTGVRRRSDVSDGDRDEQRRARKPAEKSDESPGRSSESPESRVDAGSAEHDPETAAAATTQPRPEPDCFVQTRLGWRVRCEIGSDHVVYEQARAISRMATRVPFESIPDDPVREMRISRGWGAATTVFFGLMLWCLQPLAAVGGAVDPLVFVLSTIGFAASAFMLRHQSGHFIVYPCEGKLIEFFERDEDADLRGFLELLQHRKTRYLSETYGPRAADSDSSFDPLEDLTDDPGGYRH